MKKILFFGYGANRNKNKISQITGENPGDGIGAILEGHRLAFQTLKQIPPPVNKFLEKVWGLHFKAYTIRKGKGIITGVIWQLSEDGFSKIKEWEFIGLWRELVEIKVRTTDDISLTVLTEKAPESHPITEFIDGLLYNEFSFKDLEDFNRMEDEKYYTEKMLDKIRQNLQIITSK